MTRLLQYSLEQWDELVAAPWMAATAVMDGDPSGVVGTEKETLAAQTLIKRAAAQPPSRSDLVYRIAQELRDRHKLQPPVSIAEPNWEMALDRIRRSVAILDEMTSAADSYDFRLWLFEIASEVAAAAREGFAGMGARVSDSEQAILGELRAELRLG